MISALGKLKIVMYELTTSITILPEALQYSAHFWHVLIQKYQKWASSFLLDVYLYITVLAPKNWPS